MSSAALPELTFIYNDKSLWSSELVCRRMDAALAACSSTRMAQDVTRRRRMEAKSNSTGKQTTRHVVDVESDFTTCARTKGVRCMGINVTWDPRVGV